MPPVKAVLSLIEYAIGQAHDEAEAPGASLRDEACGAARHLRLLRSRIIDFLPSDNRPDAETTAS